MPLAAACRGLWPPATHHLFFKMPQKQIKLKKKIEKPKNAKAEGNRHGKNIHIRKGRMEKPPVKAKELELYKENKELTKAINSINESTFAATAAGKGGRLKMLKGDSSVPALNSKDKQARMKAEKAREKSLDKKLGDRMKDEMMLDESEEEDD